MILPGIRFAMWLWQLVASARQPTGEWIQEWLSKSFEKFTTDLEPETIESMRETLTVLIEEPLIPSGLKTAMKKSLETGNIIDVIGGYLIMVLTSIPALLSAGGPMGNLIKYKMEKMVESFRLDPMAVITAWRRDPEAYVHLFDDLKDMGWSDERIEALKFVTLFYPAPVDLVRWQAREVFEPEMIRRYGLDSEFGAIDKEPFYKAGMTDEQILNYWRAHWEHASWMQVVEMLHRGELEESEVWDWFRVVEIPPFWRDKLIKTAYTWPTRVDVRRWWDMRTIDEPELRRLYSGMGYRGENLDNYVLWTKVYVAFPDLMARWKNGWINEADVRRELIELGMPAARVETMIQTKIKPNVPDPINEAKKVSQTAIIKWVKEDIEGRWEQGIDLLMDLGYDEAGARFILDAYIADMGSPETFEEWKQLTADYRRAAGMTTPEFNEKLREAGAELIKASAEVKSLEESVKDEEFKLVDQDVIPEEAEKRLKELRVALNRARSEKVRLQQAYDALVAEFRHTGE